MKYFRFNGKNDLWLGKYGKSERTLIPNELLTQKEVDKVKKDCPRLNIDKVFTVLDLSPNDTYISFGVRFQDGTDHNTKFESKKYSKKLSVRESDNALAKNLKESAGGVSLDGNKVLPAMGFVEADKLIPAARNFGTWNSYAMYINGTTILISDEDPWTMYEFKCDPKTVSDLFEEALLDFGYYPSGIRTIKDTVTITYEDGREKDVYVQMSPDIEFTQLLYTILPYFT